MRISFPRHSAFLAVTLLGIPAFGQLSTTPSTENHLMVAGSTSKDEPSVQQPIRQQSFTVELKTTNVQVLADGTNITRETTEVRAEDSQNRTLNSHTQVST